MLSLLLIGSQKSPHEKNVESFAVASPPVFGRWAHAKLFPITIASLGSSHLVKGPSQNARSWYGAICCIQTHGFFLQSEDCPSRW